MDIVNGITQDVVTIAGISIPRNKAIILTVFHYGGNYQSARKNGVNYRVSAGKTLKILAVRTSLSAVGTVYGQFGMADAAVDNSTIPTGFVSIDEGGYGVNRFLSEVANKLFEKCLNIEIPATKYFTIVGIANQYMTYEFLCIEE